MAVLHPSLAMNAAKSANRMAMLRLSHSKKQMRVSWRACEILGDAIAVIVSPNKGFCLTSPRSQIMGDRYMMIFSEFHL
jgi:hypothetical protein